MGQAHSKLFADDDMGEVGLSQPKFVGVKRQHLYLEKCVSCGTRTAIVCRRLFNPRMGLFGKVGKRQTMLCGATIAAARFVSGAVSGHLYVWKGR